MRDHRDRDKRRFELKILALKSGQEVADISQQDGDSEAIYRVPAETEKGLFKRVTIQTTTDEAIRAAEAGLREPVASSDTTEKTSSVARVGRIMSRAGKRMLLATSGQVGAAVTSLAVLWVAMLALGQSGTWRFEALGGLLLIRMLYHMTRGPLPVLAKYRIRKRLWWVLSDETQITIGFVAACYLMSWPIGHLAVGVFAVANLVAQVAVLGYSRLVVNHLAADVHAADETTFAQRAVILGTGTHAQRVADMVMSSPDLDTKIIGFLDYHRNRLWRYRDIPLVGHPDRLETVAANSQVDAVFVAVDPDDIPRSRGLFDVAERMGINVFVMPNVYYPTVSRIQPSWVNGMPALIYRSAPDNHLAVFAKAVVDKIGAAIGLIVASPLMLLTALAIKLESPGPVFFRQVRVGLNGKPFDLLKFRTMVADAEAKKKDLADQNEMTGPVFKIRRDPRVTRIGRILRKFSIDEIPQFFNVLTGDMSLVGPRPPLPEEVSGFQPWHHRKLSVKPGVTCLWQVSGRNRIGFDEWMRLDLEYIDNWSLWLDTKILFKTIPTVVRGTGM